MLHTKKSKIQFIIFIGIMFIFVFAFIYYFSNNKNNNFHYENGYRIDREPIKRRFPELGDFKSCYWKGDTKNKNKKDFIPAPTSYWMKGFIVLDSNNINKLKNDYLWKGVRSNWKPSIDTKILKKQSFNWRYSKEFDKLIINSSKNYIGNLYIDFENGVLYFDIEVI